MIIIIVIMIVLIMIMLILILILSRFRCCRSKNASNVLLKNLMNVTVGTIAWYAQRANTTYTKTTSKLCWGASLMFCSLSMAIQFCPNN